MTTNNESAPSPSIPPYPSNLASFSLFNCFEVVPEPTKLWNPDIAPHEMVTIKKGHIGGAPVAVSCNVGAIIVRPKAKTPMYPMIKKAKSLNVLRKSLGCSNNQTGNTDDMKA